MHRLFLTVIGCIILNTGFSQTEVDVFKRITKKIESFKPDTTTPPDDKLTRKITELRSLRGGFNINEAIDFKIREEMEENTVPQAELEKLSAFFKAGKGKTWLDNATTWIYRSHFNYKEIKQLVNFYRKPAGRKMATQFPLIMFQTLVAGEMIKSSFSK